MMPRRKTRKAQPEAPVHDRTAKDLLAAGQYAPIDVVDPYDRDAKITVLRQLRCDPLARLHSHHQIDDAQYQAGRAFQRDWEAAERGARAIDPTREAVDGGRIPEPLTDLQAAARKRLVQIESVLGMVMHRVVYSVLVNGWSMEQIAFHGFNRSGDRAANYYGRLFRDALDVLAVEYKLATK